MDFGHEGLVVFTGFSCGGDREGGFWIDKKVHVRSCWWLEIEAKWFLSDRDNHEVGITVGSTTTVVGATIVAAVSTSVSATVVVVIVVVIIIVIVVVSSI